MKAENKEKAISYKNARAIVIAIKAGSLESGITAIQTIAEVAQEKIIDEVKLQMAKRGQLYR